MGHFRCLASETNTWLTTSLDISTLGFGILGSILSPDRRKMFDWFEEIHLGTF
jgi:hypothetical protein